MTDRVRGFVHEFTWGLSRVIHPSLSSAEKSFSSDRLRTLEVVELREGETVVTREMREKIEQFTGSLWTAETRRAVEEILLILDGKDGA